MVPDCIDSQWRKVRGGVYSFNEDKTLIRANQGHSIPVDVAVKVGSRHGKPVVYTVAAGEMKKNGYVFYQSVNGVWLTKSVPPQFLQREST